MAQSNGKTSTASIEDQMSTIRSDIAVLTEMMGDLAKEKASDAKARASGKADDLKSQMRETADRLDAKAHAYGAQAQDMASNAIHEAEDAVRRQPGMAVGIAAGVGFLVGMMMARRS